MASTLAIIPARAGSKRLPNKNHRLFLGKPLILWTVDFALKYGGFDLVMVSTDSPEIAKLTQDAGAYVPWLRPAELASDTASSIDVVLHAVENINLDVSLSFDRVALLQPTSPVRVAERWKLAAEFLNEGSPAAVGVREVSTHPYWTYFMGVRGGLTPCFPEGLAMRSQDLPSVCEPNGSLYLIDINALRVHRSFTPPGTRGVLCEQQIESIDIDTAEDWANAERLISEGFK
jgi:CMP-N,N'-diacetyllegionaminic acid synthase